MAHRRARARGAGVPRRHHRAARLAHSAADFAALGRPNLFFGITAGNMDSMVNRYTPIAACAATTRTRPGGVGGRRPDRSVIVYAQRAREAFRDVLDRDRRHRGLPAPHRALRTTGRRRCAARCCWMPRPTCWCTATAERADRSSSRTAWPPGKRIADITDLRGTAFVRRGTPADWIEIDSTHLDAPGPLNRTQSTRTRWNAPCRVPAAARRRRPAASRRRASCGRVRNADRRRSVIRMPVASRP